MVTGNYVVVRHIRGKKNRFFIWRWSDGATVKKWLKPHEVKMWLDLLKED